MEFSVQGFLLATQVLLVASISGRPKVECLRRARHPIKPDETPRKALQNPVKDGSPNHSSPS